MANKITNATNKSNESKDFQKEKGYLNTYNPGHSELVPGSQHAVCHTPILSLVGIGVTGSSVF